MTAGFLFSGMGGFEEAARQMGLDIRWSCEIDTDCQIVLREKWGHLPHWKLYDDVKTIPLNELEYVDIIFGGFPCQPFSVAGEQRGTADDRHLWPYFDKIIRHLKPRWVIGENVPGIRNMALDLVLSDLESAGYTPQTLDIPAASKGFCHIRQRYWIIARRNDADAANPSSK